MILLGLMAMRESEREIVRGRREAGFEGCAERCQRELEFECFVCIKIFS
jgi:hypothetical protein